MNTRFTKKYRAHNPITIILLVLIMGISACNTPTPVSSFEYQVRVQAKDTGVELAGAQVRIEVASQAPINVVADTHGTARIFIDSSRENKPALLTVEASGCKTDVRNIDLKKDELPSVIPLEACQSSSNPSLTNIPVLSPTFDPADTSSLPDSPVCLWTSYLNGKSTRGLNDQNCLNDLKSVGISGDSQQVSFFVGGRSSGMYGVCRDISDKDNLEFLVVVRDNIVAARFLVTVGPDPVPNKSTDAFRIQPEIQSKQEKEVYLKFIEYTPAGVGKERNEMEAPTYWHVGNNWRFDFGLQFSGAKASASINQMPSPYVWSLNPPNRYLCFAYEAMTTATASAQLEVHVTFP